MPSASAAASIAACAVGDAGPPGQERRDRLAGTPVRLLGQVPDRRVRRADDDLALLRVAARRRAGAGAWTCPRRWPRPARRRRQGRRRDRDPRTGRGRRVRRRARWPGWWRSCRPPRYCLPRPAFRGPGIAMIDLRSCRPQPAQSMADRRTSAAFAVGMVDSACRSTRRRLPPSAGHALRALWRHRRTAGVRAWRRSDRTTASCG